MNTQIKKTKGWGRALLISSALATLASPSLLWADSGSPRIVSDVKVTPLAKLSPEEEQAVSQAAGRMIAHADRAWTMLKTSNGKDTQAAIAQVDKGLTLSKIIESSLPEVQSTATIKAGNLTYTDQEKSKPHLVPIFTETEDVQFLTLPKKAHHLKLSKEEREFGAMYVNVDGAKARLEKVEKLLKEGKGALAEKALSSFEDNVTFVFGEANEPVRLTASK